MKKYILVALFLLSLVSLASADIKPFVGLEGGFNMVDLSKTKKEYSDEDISVKLSNSKEFNYSVNLGSRFDVANDMYVDFKLYYSMGELANEKAKQSFAGVPGEFDLAKFKMTNPYGANLAFGYKINKEMSAFLVYGFNKVEAETNWGILGKFKKSKFLNSLGLGVNYEFIENTQVSLSYQYMKASKFSKKIDGEDFVIAKNPNTQSIKLGVSYFFNI